MQMLFTKSGYTDDGVPSGTSQANAFAIPQRADGNSLVPCGGYACNFTARDSGGAAIASVTFTGQLWLYDSASATWCKSGAAVSVTCGVQAAIRCLPLASSPTAFLQMTSISSSSVASISCVGDPLPMVNGAT